MKNEIKKVCTSGSFLFILQIYDIICERTLFLNVKTDSSVDLKL